MEVSNLIPDINASINPGKSAAGFYLGMNYSFFLNKTNHTFINSFLKDPILDSIWRIYEQDEFNYVTEKTYKYQYCYWRESITLVFSGESMKLISIQLYNTYKGKLFKEIELGDSLEKLAKEYDLSYYADMHYLYVQEEPTLDLETGEWKDNLNWEKRDIIEGIAIESSSLTSYQELKNQKITRIHIFADEFL